MEIPMLDEDEYAVFYKLYGECRRNRGNLNIDERFKPLLDYYFKVTGFEETVYNAIMHHRVAQYGPPCEKCGKPYRTPLAAFCAACGNKRIG
jgi:hypothetical protein